MIFPSEVLDAEPIAAGQVLRGKRWAPISTLTGSSSTGSPSSRCSPRARQTRPSTSRASSQGSTRRLVAGQVRCRLRRRRTEEGSRDEDVHDPQAGARGRAHGGVRRADRRRRGATNTVQIDGTIKLRQSFPAFHGKVTSPNQACAENRLVKMFKKERSGGRKLLGKTHTDVNGKWEVIVDPLASGAYLAVVSSARRAPRARSSFACATSPRSSLVDYARGGSIAAGEAVNAFQASFGTQRADAEQPRARAPLAEASRLRRPATRTRGPPRSASPRASR